MDNIEISELGHGAALKRLWHGFLPEEKKALRANLIIKRFARGEYIYKIGERPAYMMCLAKGRIKVVKDGVSGGRVQIVRVLKPVELFGYRAFFANERYETSAIAIDDCKMYFFPLSVAKEKVATDPRFAQFLLRQLSEELGLAEQRIISLTQKHVRGRLAETLLRLETRCGLQEGGIIDVRLSREDLASISNMTTSNAIRTLSAFNQEGIVELRGKQIVIANHVELEKISRLG